MERNFYFFRHGQTNENAAGLKVGNIKNCQYFHFVLDGGNWQFIDTFETGIDVVNKSDITQE